MEDDIKHWLTQPDVCRCCLSNAGTCDLTSPHFSNDGIKEVFAELLHECYGITLSYLSEEGLSRVICTACMEQLRAAICFRKQVLSSEQCFAEYFKNKIEMAINSEIKVEMEASNFLDQLIDSAECPTTKNRRKLKPETEVNKTSSGRMMGVKRPKRKSIRKLSFDDSIKAEDSDETTETTDEKKTSKLNENARLRLNIIMLLRNSTIVPFRYIKTSHNQYTCQYCDENYFLFDDLRKHEKDKHLNVSESEIKTSLKWPGEFAKAEISDIRCKICNGTFHSLDSLTDHLVEVHKKMVHPLEMKPFYGIIGFILNSEKPRCHLCSEEFNCFRSLLTHMPTHSDTNVECDLCGKRFFNKKLLRGHVRSSHKSLEHKCKFCPKTFKSMSIRRHHMKKEHEYGKHKCSECGESFNQFQQRLDHLVKVHNFKKRVYYCELCCREYANSQGFTKHMQRTHWKDKQFICEKCGKHLASNEGLKAHLRVHTGEKPYKCKFCDKRFTTHNTLHLHVRGHLNDRRYICEVCGAGFIQKHCLKGHYKVHHPEINYCLNSTQVRNTIN